MKTFTARVWDDGHHFPIAKIKFKAKDRPTAMHVAQAIFDRAGNFQSIELKRWFKYRK